MIRLTSDGKIKLFIFSYFAILIIYCISRFAHLYTEDMINIISNQINPEIIISNPPMEYKDFTQNQHRDALLALNNMTEHYCDLINSGDAGNWDPETDKPVIDAREILSQYAEEQWK